MKTKLSLLLLLVALTAPAYEFTNVYTGVSTNDGTGDRLKTAFGKINTNFLYVVNLVTITQTNWLLNTYYTNLSGRPQTVSSGVILTNAAVAGENEVCLYVGGQGVALTNVCPSGGQTLGTGIATTNLASLFAPVAPGQVCAFSNIVVGSGNSSGLMPGSGFLISH